MNNGEQIQSAVSHTPTPYSIEDPMDGILSIIANGRAHAYEWEFVAQVSARPAWAGDISAETARANAEFIVRACNAHDALLAAAKRALVVFKAQGESVRPGNVLGALESAIAKANSPEGGK